MTKVKNVGVHKHSRQRYASSYLFMHKASEPMQEKVLVRAKSSKKTRGRGIRTMPPKKLAEGEQRTRRYLLGQKESSVSHFHFWAGGITHNLFEDQGGKVDRF